MEQRFFHLVWKCTQHIPKMQNVGYTCIEWSHFVWKPIFSAYIFKMPKPISMIFDTITTSEYICWFKIHQIYKTKWCHLAKVNNWLCFKRMLREVKYKTFGNLSRMVLLIKIDSSSLSKNGKIAAIHYLLEHWTTAKQTLLVGDLIYSEAYSKKSHWREIMKWSLICFAAEQWYIKQILKQYNDVHAACFLMTLRLGQEP